jgi:hypothetical protein
VPQNALPSGEKYVSRDKSARGGIVITGLQIIEAGLPIIHITAVAERLEEAKGARKRSCRACLLSPGIVYIFYHGIAVSVNELYNVTLCIAEVLILGSIPIDRYYIPCRVVAE